MLQPGEYRRLTAEEVKKLNTAAKSNKNAGEKAGTVMRTVKPIEDNIRKEQLHIQVHILRLPSLR